MTEDPKPIKTGGPPEPTEDRPAALALHDINEQVANLRLEVEALKQRIKKLEGT